MCFWYLLTYNWFHICSNKCKNEFLKTPFTFTYFWQVPKREEMWSGVHSYIVWTEFLITLVVPGSTEMSLDNHLLLDWSEDHYGLRRLSHKGTREWWDGSE